MSPKMTIDDEKEEKEKKKGACKANYLQYFKLKQ